MTEATAAPLFPVRLGVDFYCVVGNPIGHSLSPKIHRAFADQLGHQLDYVRVELPREGFNAGLAAFIAAGGRGMNITVPFKEDAFAACGSLTARALAAGAVNTICVQSDGHVLGDNTDGEGLVRDLKDNLGAKLRGASVLMIGAGGAARGVITPLFEAGIARLVLLNRTPARAQALAQRFTDFTIQSGGLETVPDAPVSVVINATAGGLTGERPQIDPKWLDAQSFCYDMVYGPAARPFLDWAEARGVARSADGLGMLVEQAAAAFAMWRGQRPETGPVIEALRVAAKA